MSQLYGAYITSDGEVYKTKDDEVYRVKVEQVIDFIKNEPLIQKDAKEAIQDFVVDNFSDILDAVKKLKSLELPDDLLDYEHYFDIIISTIQQWLS